MSRDLLPQAKNRTSADRKPDAVQCEGTETKARPGAARAEAGSVAHLVLEKTWAFGPEGCGPNVLQAAAEESSLLKLAEDEETAGMRFRGVGRPLAAHRLGEGSRRREEQAGSVGGKACGAALHSTLVSGVAEGRREAGAPSRAETGTQETLIEDDGSEEHMWRSIENGVLTGFQLASNSGPMCDEPMWGIAFRVEAALHPGAVDDGTGFSGQIITAAREAFRRSVLDAGPRLVQAMYLCEATTTQETLGATHTVLHRRLGEIIKEDMREGSDMFVIHAYIPAAESFGLSGYGEWYRDSQ
ncbi:hypothetical protein CYMTET_17780 [Cymbomonas tetramitiformis]|uniref:Translation elongation factor EFG/EF2 domain-containing protein n=1 Tax=Cymbomonas tetramitiformis TaxID=36881 RepID=A0AAE0G9N4_9CHLO|nr:hypothetical protein CYMTET_17780 [Cymbomonas tetramitiformis]